MFVSADRLLLDLRDFLLFILYLLIIGFVVFDQLLTKLRYGASSPRDLKVKFVYIAAVGAGITQLSRP